MNSKEVIQFESEAINQGKALEEGDFKKANKAYSKIHNNYIILKEQDKVNDLIVLLEHESPYVKLWAARYLLKTSTKRSEKVLQKLGELKGISVTFDARMTLSEWKQGNLHF